ncbi:MAG TPA: hypothetical protein VFL80_10310 [Thermoanaerobaculia bacterium]|nr:hypothetical protein [Thermoanaerobaculia bacterium]
MNRWVIRAIGVLMILIFLMLLGSLQRRLVQMQQMQPGSPAPASR